MTTLEPTSRHRIGAALFYGIVAILAYLMYRIFGPFFSPLAWAAVLVVFVEPVNQRLVRPLGRTGAAAASTLAVALILVAPSIFLLTEFIRQGFTAAQAAQQQLHSGGYAWADSGWRWIHDHLAQGSPADLGDLVHQQGERVAAFLAGEAGPLLRNLAHFLLDLVVTLFVMFYLFRDGEEILKSIRGLMPFEDVYTDRILGEARDLIFASLTSTLLVAAMHGVIGTGVFLIAGLAAPIFWGVMMGFCSMIPLVGSSLIWVPVAAMLMVHGHIGRGIFVVVACAGVSGLGDNVLRPWLISGRAQLSALVVFLSVLGGISAFGFLGVVMGPIIVATAISVLDIYRVRPGPPVGTTRGGSGAVLQ
jgi:predicted PurR-regulated permease PerM